MFGLKIISKRELDLYLTVIREKTEEIDRLKKEYRHELQYEKNRAEAAINALLIKTNKIALTPAKEMSEDEQNAFAGKMYDIFGDNQAEEPSGNPARNFEEELLERIQSDRTK